MIQGATQKNKPIQFWINQFQVWQHQWV